MTQHPPVARTDAHPAQDEAGRQGRRIALRLVGIAVVVGAAVPPGSAVAAPGHGPGMTTWARNALGVPVGVGFLLVSRASDQFGQLQAAVTRAIDDLRRFLVDEPFALQPERVDELRDSVVGFVQRTVPDPVTGATLALEALSGTAIALVVLDVPLVLSLTLLVFLGAFVPILGAPLSGALAMVVNHLAARGERPGVAPAPAEVAT